MVDTERDAARALVDLARRRRLRGERIAEEVVRLVQERPEATLAEVVDELSATG
ncbi:hypothetical protein [Microbacterium sp. ZXX196]|uniref:hypothetical protein n=1 Tax=Microbacterium sp. ZXX196 TaxID=2609291 RepID=UPI0012B808A9|nr:hypothetical protein [Microbacterium sp. ZXX196]MTE22650.1 hypothetical protein [Microbacterium sp. ZXX196]